MHVSGSDPVVGSIISTFPLFSEFSYSNMCTHKALQKLKEHVDLKRQCGYITMLSSHNRHRRRPSDSTECRGKSPDPKVCRCVLLSFLDADGFPF